MIRTISRYMTHFFASVILYLVRISFRFAKSLWLKKMNVNCVICDIGCSIAASICEDVLDEWSVFVEDEARNEVWWISAVSFGGIIGVNSKLPSFFSTMQITSSKVSTPSYFTCWSNLSSNLIMKYFSTNNLILSKIRFLTLCLWACKAFGCLSYKWQTLSSENSDKYVTQFSIFLLPVLIHVLL